MTENMLLRESRSERLVLVLANAASWSLIDFPLQVDLAFLKAINLMF